MASDLPANTPAPVQELYWQWRSKMHGDRLPGRQDFDPLDLRPWLGKLALLDVVGNADDFRFRLYGTNLAMPLGDDLTGRNFTTLKCANRSELLAGYRAAVRDRRPRIRMERLPHDGN